MVNPDGEALERAVVAVKTRSKRVDCLGWGREEATPPDGESAGPSHTVGVGSRSVESRGPVEAGVYH